LRENYGIQPDLILLGAHLTPLEAPLKAQEMTKTIPITLLGGICNG